MNLNYSPRKVKFRVLVFPKFCYLTILREALDTSFKLCADAALLSRENGRGQRKAACLNQTDPWQGPCLPAHTQDKYFLLLPQPGKAAESCPDSGFASHHRVPRSKRSSFIPKSGWPLYESGRCVVGVAG